MKKTRSIQTRLLALIPVMLFFALFGAVAALYLVRRFALYHLWQIGGMLLAYAVGVTLIFAVLMTATARSIAKCFEDLRKQDDAQHTLAWFDSLTGLQNANAYNEWAQDFDSQIKEGTDGIFGLMLLDINDLKVVNDRFGHEVGNKIICATSDMLREVFGRSPVFRIGGDEFLVILQDRDLLRFAGIIERFSAASESLSVTVEDREIPITVAYGTAIFDAEQDRSFADVFNRADNIMYENKRKTKA